MALGVCACSHLTVPNRTIFPFDQLTVLLVSLGGFLSQFVADSSSSWQSICVPRLHPPQLSLARPLAMSRTLEITINQVLDENCQRV